MPHGLPHGPNFGLASRRLPPGLRLPEPGQLMTPKAPGPSGLAALLQRPGVRDLLLAAGSSLLQSSDDPRVSVGGALGRAVQPGLQALQQGQQRAAVDEALESAPESMRRLLSLLPADQRGMAAFQMMTQPGPDPVSLGEGDVLVDPTTGEQIAQAPGQPDIPSDLRMFRAFLGMSPEEREDFEAFSRSRRGPSTTVNVGDKDPAKRALVDIEAGEVKASLDAARTARDQLGNLREIERIMDEGVETGALEEKTLPARELAAAFGVGNADELIQQQNFQALSNAIAINMTQGLRGQISERELDFVRAAVPNIGTTKEANRRIVDIGKRLNETAIKVAEAQRRYFRENGTLDGFEQQRQRIVRENLLDNLPDASTGGPRTPADLF